MGRASSSDFLTGRSTCTHTCTHHPLHSTKVTEGLKRHFRNHYVKIGVLFTLRTVKGLPHDAPSVIMYLLHVSEANPGVDE